MRLPAAALNHRVMGLPATVLNCNVICLPAAALNRYVMGLPPACGCSVFVRTAQRVRQPVGTLTLLPKNRTKKFEKMLANSKKLWYSNTRC